MAPRRITGPEPPPFPDRWGTSTAAAEDAAEKRVRRERLARMAGLDAMVLVMSADDSPGFTGSTQNSDFTYLSPFDARGAAVLLALKPRTDAATSSDRRCIRAPSFWASASGSLSFPPTMRNISDGAGASLFEN